MVSFEIYHGVDFGYDSWFSSNSYPTIDSLESSPRSNSFNSDPNYIRKHDRPFIYWIIMGCVVLFILVFVLFTSFCIVRNNHESAKMRAELQFFGPATYTANKRSAIYMTTPSTNRRQSTTGIIQFIKNYFSCESPNYTLMQILYYIIKCMSILK